ncbi:MAG: glycosyltransferase family 39 protein [bacterium]|nr:glycosyltransferase family 39 protein [bacterium]
MSGRRAPQAHSVARPWLIPLLIFLVAFGIRLFHVVQLESMPTFDDPTMDEGYHMELVKQINSPQGYPNEPYFRAPLYPYLLAFLFKMTGGSFFGVRIIQILLGALVPVLLFFLGKRIFNKQIGLWSGWIAVFYPTLIYYDASLLITLLEVLLSLSTILLLVYSEGRSRWLLIAAGIMLGLGGIARPTILLFGPALLIWGWFILRPQYGLKKAITAISLVGFSSLLVVLPVTIRNYVVADEFITISWQGGYNFYVGNNSKADGWSARVEGIDASWRGGYLQSIAIAEQAAGKKLTFSEVSDYWSTKTWQEISAEPGRFFGLLVKKARLLINGYEIPNNQDEYLPNEYSSVMNLLLHRGWLYFPYGLLAPLGLIGIGLSLRDWRKYLLPYLFIGAFSASLIAFFVCSRFRQPLVPLLILFAVFAVYKFIELWKAGKLKPVIICVIAFLALAVESNHDLLKLNMATVEAENRDLLGNAYLRKGKLDFAIIEYQKAVAANPTYGRGYNNIGTVLSRQGRFSEAAPYFQKAMQYDSRLPEPYINLSICYSETKDFANAVAILEQAKAIFPTNPPLYYYLSLAYVDLMRVKDAKIAAEEAVRLDPANQDFQRLVTELNAIPADQIR